MREIDVEEAARALEATDCNFLRRSAELELSMSGAKWRLAERTPERLTFRAVGVDGALLPDAMVLRLADVQRITWDRLPRQESRSQIRFHHHSGELWTFSGHVADALLP
ncbi:MAG TPA: hypothetical protein VFE37_22785 [Chloroflexota bacterium]|nr:hypothetical protein [Chloroflexota bacterium]